jgi:hypothetical protein
MISRRDRARERNGPRWFLGSCTPALASAVALVALCSACGSDATGIQLTVTSDVEIDQLAVEGTAAPDVVYERVQVPSPARTIEAEGETLVILVDESLAGREVTLTVEGLQAGDVVTSGAETTVRIASEHLVPAAVHLTAPADLCGGVVCTDDQACVDDACVCDAGRCDGCCGTDEHCQPGLDDDVCGSGGNACEACPDGDTCEGGVCGGCALTCDGCCSGSTCEESANEHCGVDGAACATCSLRAPMCVNGGCQCEDRPACEPGQACSNGLCVCNGTSCPDGCCSSNVCQIRSFDSCATGGDECMECDVQLADGCSNVGACTCGGGQGCDLGQFCLGGSCFCDGSSCPGGCCDEDFVCHSTTSADFCGLNGSSCAECDEARADGCVDGQCACGEGPACGPSQRCVAHACVCNETSCPSGCCDGGTCAEIGLASCGAEGGPCTACDPLRADRCTGGSCRCGDDAQCEVGQRCDAALGCVCDTESCSGCCDVERHCDTANTSSACGSGGADCADCGAEACIDGACSGCADTCAGCCSGTDCTEVPTQFACGDDGSACVACGPRSDRCSADGHCQCGPGGTPCAPGQRCVGGECLCDAGSCPNGCCEGNLCQERSPSDCGVAGEPCTDCGIAADTCTSVGDCACGAGSECDGGQRCEGGRCLCDTESCPDGCCSDITCHTPPDFDFCGSAGEVCETCSDGYTDNCEDGDCHCGLGEPCDSGQVCSSGVCRCTRESCPSGCCDGNNCKPNSMDFCGTDGGTCSRCDLVLTDRCDDGVCTCGSGNHRCSPGQECVDGACVCGPRTCTGCCSGATCVPFSGMTASLCGSAGLRCERCISMSGTDTCANGACTACAEDCLGCCSGATCYRGDADDICGRTGHACTNCEIGHAVCDGGACSADTD